LKNAPSRSPYICVLPRLSESGGGPASFFARFKAGLQRRGIPVTHDPRDPAVTAILIIGGTTQLWDVWRARQRGVRVVQRLNGMNWMHRKRRTPWGAYLRAERSNWLLSWIRRNLADHIIYQSEFARGWWQTVYGKVRARGSVVYNGVDLREFSPIGGNTRPSSHYRLLLVEGRIGAGNVEGLSNAVELAQEMDRLTPRGVRLQVVGEVDALTREQFERQSGGILDWAGQASRDQIPAMDRSAHLLFSADLNAACPNAVVEALACGLPVAAFATGALPELIEGDCGRVTPYGSNYWNLEKPDVPTLARAAMEILADQPRFRAEARRRAEGLFDVEHMLDAYLRVLAPER